jgi:hypothetical protein
MSNNHWPPTIIMHRNRNEEPSPQKKELGVSMLLKKSFFETAWNAFDPNDDDYYY